MLIHIAIILIYLSFVLDFVVWPIPSEGSTGSILSRHSNSDIWTRIGLVLLYAANLVFYLFPLFIAINYLLSPSFVHVGRAAPCIVLAILGRLVTIKGALTIRRNQQGSLITNSIFKFSRNPIVLGMHLTIIGLIVCYPKWYLWIGFVLYFLNMHFKIKIEERYLSSTYRAPYKQYLVSTPRYLIW